MSQPAYDPRYDPRYGTTPQPAYAPAPPAPPQGYYQQPPPQQPPQGYYQGPPPGYGPPPQAPPLQLPKGTLGDYMNQPSGSGQSITGFLTKALNQSITGFVARPITDADIQVQTDKNNQPVRFRDGRYKYHMIVPLERLNSGAFEGGRGAWYVKGQSRDALAAAMATAGAPAGPPEFGAMITVTYIGEREISGGFSNQKLYHVNYVRPEAAAQAAHGNGAYSAPTPPVQAPDPAFTYQGTPQDGYADARPAQDPQWAGAGQQGAPQYQAPPPPPHAEPTQYQAPPPPPMPQYGPPQTQQLPGQPPQQAPQSPAGQQVQYATAQGQQAAQAAMPPQGQGPQQGQNPWPQGVPQDMTPEQAALLQRLTGGQVPAPAQ